MDGSTSGWGARSQIVRAARSCLGRPTVHTRSSRRRKWALTRLANRPEAAPSTNGPRMDQAVRVRQYAPRSRSQDATGIEDPERVERVLDRPHDRDRALAALDRQPLAPRRPDAVLRSDRAAQIQRRPEDLVADDVRQAGR